MCLKINVDTRVDHCFVFKHISTSFEPHFSIQTTTGTLKERNIINMHTVVPGT